MPPPALAEPNCVTLVTLMPPKSDPAIVPELLMPPKKLATLSTRIAVRAAEIMPELKMPPPALAEPNWVTLVILMPTSLIGEAIVPLLVMPPKKLVTPLIRIPVSPAVIVPELLTPPKKV